jgi:hypothetical protein
MLYLTIRILAHQKGKSEWVHQHFIFKQLTKSQHGLKVVHNPSSANIQLHRTHISLSLQKRVLATKLDYEVYQKLHPIIALEFHFHSITFLKLL